MVCWYMPIIPEFQEGEAGTKQVWAQPKELCDLVWSCLKIKSKKKVWGGSLAQRSWAQFQYHKKLF